MNYLKSYCKLIRNAESRNWKRKCIEFYIEEHHIFPVSIYGKNNRTVLLTPREHFLAHWLLYKICLKRYGIRNNKTFSMGSAFAMMCVSNDLQERTYTSRQYEIVRKCLSKIRTGKKRNDMMGKKYFGASEDSIKNGIEKMKQKKIGMKIEYPKNRKSAPCSIEKSKKISETRKNTKLKFISMSEEEFSVWISNQNLYRKDGARNSNVTRVLMWRNLSLENYYGN
jgi:DNA integrity scanning protein DisA with diadenylate cyclase activity